MKILNIILIILLSTLVVSLGVVVAQDIQNPEDKNPTDVSINLEMPVEETKSEVTLGSSNKDQNDLVIDSIDSITKEKPSISISDSGGRSREREKNAELVNNVRAPRTTTNQKFGTFTGIVELYVDGKPVERQIFVDGVGVKLINLAEEVDPSILEDTPGDTEPIVILLLPLDGTEFEGPSRVIDFLFIVTDDGWISECSIIISSEGGLTITEIISFPDQSFISNTGATYTRTASIELNSEIYTAQVLCIDNTGNTGSSAQTLFTITNGPGPEANQLEEIANEETGCRTDWTCSEWSECNPEAGTQERTCTKEINNCYANPNDKPEETQTCVTVEEVSAPIEELGIIEQSQDFLSRITGAVVGLGDNPGLYGPIILIFVIIVGGYTVVAMARKKKR